MTIKHVWEHAKMQKHRASKATTSKLSLDWEPHAKTAFLSRSVEHSENDSQFHYKKTHTQTQQRNGQHSEAARSEKWAAIDMFAKSVLGTREIRSQVEKRKKHTFEFNVFNVQYFWSRAKEIAKMSFGNLKAGISGPSWRPRNAKR